MPNASRNYDDRAPRNEDAPRRQRTHHNDNRPPEKTEWQKMQPPQQPKIVDRARVIRQNISADSLDAVADAQRGERGKVQRRELRSLARSVLSERGW
jgi:hypothetical protein